MEDMVLKVFMPNRFLQPYISKIWIFESKYGIPKSDLKLIAPNGEMKLVIPYKNNMRSTIENKSKEHKEASFIIIGQMTKAAIIESEIDFGSIGIDFKPYGAYKFFPFPLSEITNYVYHAPDLFTRMGSELQDRLSEISGINEKVRFIEEFLLKQMLELNKDDSITELAVNRIVASKGLIGVEELSEEVGYSRRHMVRKFTETIGLSPKEFSCIVRFHEIYKKYSLNSFNEEDLYELYYDQSHFVKEFKRFSGMTPGEYLSQTNKFGSIFYNV